MNVTSPSWQVLNDTQCLSYWWFLYNSAIHHSLCGMTLFWVSICRKCVSCWDFSIVNVCSIQYCRHQHASLNSTEPNIFECLVCRHYGPLQHRTCLKRRALFCDQAKKSHSGTHKYLLPPIIPTHCQAFLLSLICFVSRILAWNLDFLFRLSIDQHANRWSRKHSQITP